MRAKVRVLVHDRGELLIVERFTHAEFEPRRCKSSASGSPAANATVSSTVISGSIAVS
ncbi:MAG: hypothetical protein R2855_09890 [Thermomicrobiales bacterium]